MSMLCLKYANNHQICSAKVIFGTILQWNWIWPKIVWKLLDFRSRQKLCQMHKRESNSQCINEAMAGIWYSYNVWLYIFVFVLKVVFHNGCGYKRPLELLNTQRHQIWHQFCTQFFIQRPTHTQAHIHTHTYNHWTVSILRVIFSTSLILKNRSSIRTGTESNNLYVDIHYAMYGIHIGFELFYSVFQFFYDWKKWSVQRIDLVASKLCGFFLTQQCQLIMKLTFYSYLGICLLILYLWCHFDVLYVINLPNYNKEIDCSCQRQK